MKTKRRSVNSTGTVKVCNKKIVTRNMQNKLEENGILPVSTSCNNQNKNKGSPNTRAKSFSKGKLESDPYAFSKIDEECKIQVKKMKLTEKNGKDAAVNTCHFSTMTDPELLGPCEPGTSIELQGIVWLETVTGLLVINVTWRGRTYVGTLLDSTKYEFSPPSISQDFSGKSECRQTNRQNRGKKRTILAEASNHTSLRSASVRHSHRLSESLSYLNNNKKSSARLALNTSCYIDSLSLSAEASCSGESDVESNNHQKYALGSKTRSVTRSLAKQNKVTPNDLELNSSEPEKSMEKCSQPNCFKQFSDTTALTYHLQRSHGIFDDITKEHKTDNNDSIENTIKNDGTFYKFSEIKNRNDTQRNCKKSHEKIKNEDETSKLHLESSEGGFDHKCNNINIEDKGNSHYGHLTDDGALPELLELSLPLSDLSELVTVSHIPTSPIDVLMEGGGISSNRIIKTDHSILPIVDLSGNPSSQTNAIIRTVTAPTVSIPLESTTTVTSIGLSSSSNASPAVIKPKPGQVSLDLSYTPQSKKLKPSKTVTHSNGVSTSFQIPPSSTSKKRPLVAIKTAVTQGSVSNHYMSSLNTTSSKIIQNNHLSRQIRSSTVSNVTPILPATSTSNNVTSAITNSVTSTGSVCSNMSFNNSQNNQKRTLPSSSSVSPSLMTSLISLKPIQPKPKSSSVVSRSSNSTSTTFMTPAPTVNLPGILAAQTSYQRQILPSPVFKMENTNYSDERLIHKIECIKTTKKKRRKTEKKLRLNIHECNRPKKFPFNSIQPKRNNEYKECPVSADGYKMDEENSHSPEYSDLSETNDTPAPILEKEIELRSVDCDKLIICSDFGTSSTNKISTSISENFGDIKGHSMYNKPPALMPAVLSSDILNGTTNDINLSDSIVKTGRWTHKRPMNSIDSTKDSSRSSSDNKNIIETEVSSSSSKYNHTNTSCRKSFQSSSYNVKYSSAIIPPSKVSLYSSSQSDFDKNSKFKLSNKCSNLSAINDYVWMTKKSHSFKSKNLRRFDEDSYQTKTPYKEDNTINKL